MFVRMVAGYLACVKMGRNAIPIPCRVSVRLRLLVKMDLSDALKMAHLLNFVKTVTGP